VCLRPRPAPSAAVRATRTTGEKRFSGADNAVTVVGVLWFADGPGNAESTPPLATARFLIVDSVIHRWSLFFFCDAATYFDSTRLASF
jgi:hypothetical protein